MKNTLKTLALLSLLSPLFLFANEREEIDPDGFQEEVVGSGKEGQSNLIINQYPGIYFPTSAHALTNFSAYGNAIELEDGSLWRITTSDFRETACNWPINDTLSIVQNTRWFSSYYYRIINRRTGESIETNLSNGPFKNGPLTNYVTEYDFAQGIVTLSNPNLITHWEIHPSDLSDFREWDFTQAIPVVVGDNSNYDPDSSSQWECILINVRKSKKYVRAHQF